MINHWTLLVIKIGQKSIHYYDSLYRPNNKKARFFLDSALRYLSDEAQQSEIAFDAAEWSLVQEAYSPQQRNGCDCGVFTIMNADFMTDNLDLTYNQQDVYSVQFRKKICANVLRGKLKYPLYCID
jgi:sentrin-specific protease 1